MRSGSKIAARGFTLVELLVVLGIIAILVGMAIPQYSSYSRKGFIAAIKADLHNAATAQEAYFVKKEVYTTSVTDLLNSGFKQSANVSLSITVGEGGQDFTLTATHTNCGTDTWTFTGSGPIIEPTTPCE